MTPRQVEYMVGAAIYGAWLTTILHAAAAALRDWRRKRQLRGQRRAERPISVASEVRPAITFNRNRLRYRAMPLTYAQLKGGDIPFVEPNAQEPIAIGRGQMRELESRNPDLTHKLQQAALDAEAQVGGPITSADVWAILDPATREQAKKVASGKIMSAAFDTPDWEKTGRYLPKGSQGRPIAEWIRKSRVAA